MDAPSFNGSDDRESLSLPPRQGCRDCGAVGLEPCKAGCGCAHCRSIEWERQELAEQANKERP